MHARKRLMFKNRDRARKAANHAAAAPATPVVEKVAPVTPVAEKVAPVTPVVEKVAPVAEKVAPKARPLKKTSTTKRSAVTSKKK